MMLPPFRCRRQNVAFLLAGLSPQHGLSERSPDERSDIRIFASAEAPACRFTHAGYLLAGSHRRHSGMRRKAQTRNPWRHNITWSERSPDERSDIRVFASVVAPACRFTHAGYLLRTSSHRRHSGMRRKAQTRNPWRHNITWRNGFPDVQLHIKARSPGANLMLASILSQGSRPGMTNDAAIALHLTRF
jgi:hypothetical protein